MLFSSAAEILPNFFPFRMKISMENICPRPNISGEIYPKPISKSDVQEIDIVEKVILP